MIDINEITGIMIAKSIRMHKDIGRGLMEEVYEELLAYRLKKRGHDEKRKIENRIGL